MEDRSRAPLERHSTADLLRRCDFARLEPEKLAGVAAVQQRPKAVASHTHPTAASQEPADG